MKAENNGNYMKTTLHIETIIEKFDFMRVRREIQQLLCTPFL